mmetsp:Transcript_34281/g.80127  ORF Transcript_34281/g.80127 Transcript_34281/m.80127 type:complete len:323 (+) Transcript_34281:43-1011(+)
MPLASPPQLCRRQSVLALSVLVALRACLVDAIALSRNRLQQGLVASNSNTNNTQVVTGSAAHHIRLDHCYHHAALGKVIKMASHGVEAALRLEQSPASRRFHSCAVIGSGASLHDSGFGNAIDAHDAVIRMNGHPTKGFEADVGRKTTFRFLYPESSSLLGQLDEASAMLVLVPFKKEDNIWLDCVLAHQDPCHCVRERTKTNTDPWFKPLPFCGIDKLHSYGIAAVLSDKARATERTCAIAAALKKRPSMGFTTVTFALSICDAVDAYGMNKDERYHHEEGAGPVPNYTSPTMIHDVIGEHEFYKRMEALGRLRRPDRVDS